MGWTAAAIIGSAIIGSIASKKAADAQKSAANQASGVSQAQYDQTRKDLAPYRDIGSYATNELGALYGFPAINQDGSPDSTQPQNMLAVNPGTVSPVSPAMFGRNGDTTVGHLTPGETVVPQSVATQPGVQNALAAGFNNAGISPAQYTVGGPNSVNPRTGLREFADYGMSGQDYGGYHGDISGGSYGMGNPRDASQASGDTRNPGFINNMLARNFPTPAPAGPTLPADYYTQQAAIDRFYKSPDYTLAFNEGQKALEQSAAARGGLFSGNTGTALVRYGQQYGGNLYNQYANRLASFAGLGENAAAQTGNYGMQTAGQQGNALMYGGNAAAQGWEGLANSVNAGIGNALYYNYLNG